MATDLTGQVKARKEVEHSEEIQRFTIEAADAGTWRLYPATKKLIASDRFKQIFGFRADEEITYEQAVSRIPEEYRGRVEAEVSKAKHRAKYNVEHPINGFDDQKLRWIRAIGKLKIESDAKKTYFQV